MEIALSGGAFPYLEIAYVCAPNTSAQTVSSNTLATLTLDTIVQNTFANFTSGNLSGNVITIPTGDIGTFYGELYAPIVDNTVGNGGAFNLYLNNATASDKKEIRGNSSFSSEGGWNKSKISGQFKLTVSSALSLQCLPTSIGTNLQVRNGTYNSIYSNSTAGLDQRGTVKLWKIA